MRITRGGLLKSSTADGTYAALAGNDQLFTGRMFWRGPSDAANITAKPTGDGRSGVFDLLHNDTVGYIFHLTCGTSMAHTAALIGLGVDEDGIGLLIPNKKLGRGIVGDQRSTVTASDGYWLSATQQSAAAPLVRFEMQADNAADILQLVAFGTPGTGQRLLYVQGPNGTQAGAIYASDGRMEWRRNVSILDKDGSTASYLDVQDNNGVAANRRNHVLVGKQSVEWYADSGSASTWWPYMWKAAGSAIGFYTGGTTGVVGTQPTNLVIAIQNQKIGFLGASAIARRATTADATDLASVITLANALKADLVAFGFKS